MGSVGVGGFVFADERKTNLKLGKKNFRMRNMDRERESKKLYNKIDNGCVTVLSFKYYE